MPDNQVVAQGESEDRPAPSTFRAVRVPRGPHRAYHWREPDRGQVMSKGSDARLGRSRAVLESRDKLAKSRRSFSMLFSNLNDLQM